MESKKIIEKTIKIFLSCLPVLLVFFCFSCNIFAAVMSSTHYAIQSDNITPSGGAGLSSVNYFFRDTMGEVSTGPSTSSNYALRSGWQEMQETYLTVSAPATVNMTPTIPGVSGGVATGTGQFTVITDNLAGFAMGINASTSHAMILGGTDSTQYFDNYTTGATPTYGWTVSHAAKFGFTVVPGALGGLVAAFKDNGSACGSGSGSGNCYAGLLTSSTGVINLTQRTGLTGEQENINLKAQSDNTVLKSGTYKATIIATVSAN